MSIRNVRITEDRRGKKEARQKGVSILPYSNLLSHLVQRSLERNQGMIVPFCRKKLENMIKQGKVKTTVCKGHRGRLIVSCPEMGIGKIVVKVDKKNRGKIKEAITYIN